MGKHKYTLVYLNMRGRAEVSRLIFAHAGVEYEDKRYELEDWPKHKHEAPMGQLPYLVIDGVKLAQSNAIARYLAREYGLYGKTAMETAKIDEIVDEMMDFLQLVANVHYADAKDKAAETKKLNQKAPEFLNIFTRILKENSGGYAVGTQFSLADIYIYNYLEQFREFFTADVEAEFSKNDTLMKHRAKVETNPRIAEWIKKRPVTKL